ncbi:MAG: hypothetical protein ACLFQM_12205 [Fidelibacterota bacterium]
MKLCERCGNEIDISALKCPYCGMIQQQKTGLPTTKSPQIEKINIKIGLPTVNEALRRAKQELHRARRNQYAVVKLVHGYGSSGEGGKIRIALRDELRRMKNTGIIRNVIPGEEFTPKACKQLLRRFSFLRDEEDLNQHNKGITIVEL